MLPRQGGGGDARSHVRNGVALFTKLRLFGSKVELGEAGPHHHRACGGGVRALEATQLDPREEDLSQGGRMGAC